MKIYIPEAVYQTMQGFVLNCDFEISWIGKVLQYKDGFIIKEVRLIEQEVSATRTSISGSGVNGTGQEWAKIIEEEGSLKDWKLWGHSHAEMKTFWSTIDEREIFDHENQTRNNNWLLSIEFNHKMEWLCRLDVFYPIHLTKHITNMKIIRPHNQEIDDYCMQEIADKVTIKEKIIEPEIIREGDPLSQAIAKMNLKNKS